MWLTLVAIGSALLGGLSFFMPWISSYFGSESGKTLVQYVPWTASDPVGPRWLLVAVGVQLLFTLGLPAARGSRLLAGFVLIFAAACLGLSIDWLSRSGLTDALAIGFWLYFVSSIVGCATAIALIVVRGRRGDPANAHAMSRSAANA